MRMIDADDLLMLIDDHDNMVLEDVKSSCLKDVYKMAHVHIKDLIGMMPTVERKTGKWIETDDGWDGTYFVCSNCGRPWKLIDGDPKDNGMNYCPNCGSKMEGEKLLLRLRYIKHLKWEAVALEMELPVRRVYYLHGTALSHFMEDSRDN